MGALKYNSFYLSHVYVLPLKTPNRNNIIFLHSFDSTIRVDHTLDLTREFHNLLQRNEDGVTNSYTYDFGLLSADGNTYLLDDLGSPVRFGEEAYEYDEFGQSLHEYQSAQPFGFTGYQNDEISSTLFAQARQYDPQLGRFTSQDSHWNPSNLIYGDAVVGINNTSLLPNPLAIRQSSNLYEYGLSNPKRYIDPLGNQVWLVPGTDGENGIWFGSNNSLHSTRSHWHHDTRLDISGLFGNQTVNVLSWRGDNTPNDRTTAAERLAAEIRAYHSQGTGQPIRIVGYSHGGNVAIEAINILAAEGIHVDKLITIATPSRDDYRVVNGAVGRHLNVYNTDDDVQIHGGRDSFWRTWNWGSVKLSAAERHQPNAINIRVLARPDDGDYHGFMHNDWEIWTHYIEPRLEPSMRDLPVFLRLALFAMQQALNNLDFDNPRCP